MYLKSLTLKGFKSFAQPTTFAFETGVTCVVGPNGSGKSNVVDALAWVMGEQGAKTLRGGKMDDVIFAGTATRGPLGRAEVVLTIDNSDGALPIEYTEVTISRTLFRGGGSEYAINGSGCRLLDVQELLSDSGLGREMHVIVGQGQLDAVLHASPEERRGFIEEAAGILKHRRRKEKTLRKLDAMQVNLTRLGDLAGEIRRQLKPLGHQAEIAREAQEIAAVVRDARARILADDVVNVRATMTAQSKRGSERKTERIVLQEQLDQARLRASRLEQAQIGDAVDIARRTAFGLESVQERLRNVFSLANQRLALLGQQAEDVPAPSVTPQSVQDAADEAERLREQIVLAETAWLTAQQATAAARTMLDSSDEHLSQQSDLVSRHDLELSKLEGQLDAAGSRSAAVRGEVLRQQNALDAALARRDAAQVAWDAAQRDTADEFSADTDLDAAYDIAQAVVSDAEAEIDLLRETLHGHEREREALTARVSALSSALDTKDGSSALVAAKPRGVRGLVADHVKVQPGYEAAIAAALGSLADAVLADDRDSAISAITHAKARNLGRIEVVVAEGDVFTEWGAELPPGAVAAASVVTAPSGVLGMLARIVIADHLQIARDVWSGIPFDDRASTTVITRDGDTLSTWVLRGGSGQKVSRLELVADRDAATARAGEVDSLIERARFSLAEQRATVDVARAQSALALTTLRDFDAQLASRTEKLNRARGQVEASQAEADRVNASITVTDAAVTDAAAGLAQAEAARDAALSRPRPILDVSERDAVSGELEGARELEVEARLVVETARERVRAEELRAEALTRQLEAERIQADEQARRAVIRRSQQDATQQVLAALPAVLDSVDRSVSEARVALAARQAERAQQNDELAALRLDENSLRERLHAVSEDVHGLEMQLYESKLHLSALLERAGNELGLVEDVLVAEYGPDSGSTSRSSSAELSEAGIEAPIEPAVPELVEGPPALSRADQERRLAAAERKFAQLGRVNPLALEEFAALEQRQKFLTEQLTDLTRTRADLLTIIDDIDDKMESIFSSAFDDTQAAFNEVFPILFPGGTGSIHLTDPDNMLTTGIEVAVKPAGKKIERLSLLSGGERSLAAIALMIAIFKARPSPFYIMDEVEAALDDANLGRLLSIFEDLRVTSQLIIITHQKRTMEIADALYGVSMRADGISAVVGQRVAADAD